MVSLTIDGHRLEVAENTTILDAAKSIGIVLPTLCYLEGVNDIGACRVCVVEVEGVHRLVSSCNTLVEEGMVVFTNSPRAREARRTNVELILSQHDARCATCVRSGNCSLQTIANDLGIISERFPKNIRYAEWERDFPLVRHEEKCIKCMRCIQICNNVQSTGVWDAVNSGSKTSVGVYGGRKISEAHCAICGQCITHCPTGALRERDDTEKAFAAIADPEMITVVQLAPAVRNTWGETLGMERSQATANRLATALKRIGFDYVCDTAFTADVTIMEEGKEFISLLEEGDASKFPLMTSCCPGWVRFLKSSYPELTTHLSTAKSPQQMFGSIARRDIAKTLGVDPSKLFVLSVMPCVAKKSECALPTMKGEDGVPDVNVSLTTREVDRMIRQCHIDPTELEETPFDELDGSGAGVIFGATGGVMEAALRSVYYLVTGERPAVDAFKNVRGDSKRREATFSVGGTDVNVAVVSGLGNARALVEDIVGGRASYHFVEVMACPGGCSGGGGQPIRPNQELAEMRGGELYQLDEAAAIRFSHENPKVGELYERYPDISHCLHTNHFNWDMPLSPMAERKRL